MKLREEAEKAARACVKRDCPRCRHMEEVCPACIKESKHIAEAIEGVAKAFAERAILAYEADDDDEIDQELIDDAIAAAERGE